MIKALVACEESQATTSCLLDLGVDAWSCDLKPCSGSRPDRHIQDDALFVLRNYDWDLLIAHPPCTYLSSVTAPILTPERIDLGRQAAEFFMCFYDYDCIPYRCIENPTPLSIFNLPPYSQIVNPYLFGDPWRKRTCLWLRNLPRLQPISVVQPTFNLVESVHGSELRSKTSPGLGFAMANQFVTFMEVFENYEL